MPRALLVIPAQAFSCSAYQQLRALLAQHGLQVQVASAAPEAVAPGVRWVAADLTLDQARARSTCTPLAVDDGLTRLRRHEAMPRFEEPRLEQLRYREELRRAA